MTDRPAFSLVVNDDVSHEWLDRVVAAIDDGEYLPEQSRAARRPFDGIIAPQALVHVRRGSTMPKIGFLDHDWNLPDDDPLETVRPDFANDTISDDGLFAMARACLTAPWMDRADKKRHHPVIVAPATVSAQTVPENGPFVGACAPSPWGRATSYEAESMIGGPSDRTPTDPDIAAMLPRLVSMSLIDGTYGKAPRIVLMPYGYRIARTGLPDTIEILRILSTASTS
jgi:hypothetical protein